MTYNLFKFLHVASVIVWLGGVSTLTVLNIRLTRDSVDHTTQASLAREAAFLGRAVVGPAAGLTLIAGIATAVVGSLDMGALWITWGFAGIIISMALGGTLIRRTTVSLETALTGSSPAEVGSLRGRLTTLNLINLVLLLSVVAAMVFKPTL
jgi:protoporphyrinogen IX oxidase